MWLALALLGLMLAGGASADTAGIVWTGEAGVSETIERLMQRQAAVVEGPREPTFRGPNHQKHDRSGIPQNPAAQDLSQWPALGTSAISPEREVTPFAPQPLGVNFTGATLLGTNPTFAFPPDCMGDVGPSQYVVFVNGRLVSFSKSTGVADGVLNIDPDVFFASIVNGSYTSDPRIRYDRFSGRWFLVIINVSTPNRILLAVSDAASNGTLTGSTVFTLFYIPIDTVPPAISNTCLADYPTLGIDHQALYIGTNNFCGAGLSFNSTDGYVIRKSSILGAGPMVLTVFRGLVPTAAAVGPYTPQGVDNFDASATEGYFLGVDNATFSTLMLRRVTDPAGTPSISGNISIATPATTSFPVLVPHLGNTNGNSGRLSALDDRLFAAVIRNGRLWTAHNIGVTNAGSATGTRTRNAARWYQLQNVASPGVPSFVQSGTLFQPSATNVTTERNYWIPSIMVNGQGHTAMGFSVAGTNERINAGTAGRLSGDALGTMQAPTLFTSSATAYNPPSNPGGTSGRRWGDYSYTSVDPIDDMTMWTVQEFCDATNSYGVRVVQLIAPPPALPVSADPALEGFPSYPVTVSATSASGSGFFDPGPDLPGGVPAYSHLNVAVTNTGVTGTPPTVNSVTVLSPTSLMLDLNTVGASPNLSGEKYTVVVTNPDGQMATGSMVLEIRGAPTATLLSLFVANPLDGGIELRWRYGQPERFASTQVERASRESGPWSALTLDVRDDAGTLVAFDGGVESGQQYHYRLVATLTDGSSLLLGPVSGKAGSGIAEFALGTVQPNPTKGVAHVSFTVPRQSPVRLSVLDIQGREVAKLIDGALEPGRYQVTWTGNDARGPAASGVYFVKFEAGGKLVTRRLILAR
jgi:hypothetical protein